MLLNQVWRTFYIIVHMRIMPLCDFVADLTTGPRGCIYEGLSVPHGDHFHPPSMLQAYEENKSQNQTNASSTNPYCIECSCNVRIIIYRIAGNFRGRKLSRISRFFCHPRKFSPRNSRHTTPIMRPVLTFRESFLREMLLSYRSAKVFSLENFPLYGITIILTTIIDVFGTHVWCNNVSVIFLWESNPNNTSVIKYPCRDLSPHSFQITTAVM